MSHPRVGLIISEKRVTGAAIWRGGRVTHWNLDADESLSARLATELEPLGSPAGRVRLALDRALVIVKPIEVPRAADRDLPRLITFELARRVPFPADDVRFDWLTQPGGHGEARRLLVTACEGRFVATALRLVEGLKRRPRSLTIAAHDLRALLPRRLPARRALWVHRYETGADLLCLADGALVLSRRLPSHPSDALAEDLARTLPLVGWEACDAIWISGADADRFIASSALAVRGTVVSTPPYRSRAAALIAQVPVEQQPAALPALGVALGVAPPRLDLLPRELRPRTPTLAQRATVGLAALAGLMAIALAVTHGYMQERYLRQVSDEIRRLQPEMQAVERLAGEVADRKRLLTLVRTAEQNGLHPVAVLHELTNLVPADAWLQAISLDTHGVELTGQAGAASQLIPVLEASPDLQRVELTAPVTKTQGKEQFRLHAVWER
jgi:Tfp pilus assembly protein PilN